MTTLSDVLHNLVDRAGFADESTVRDMHDTIRAKDEGHDSLESYRDAQAKAAQEKAQPAAAQPSDDDILARADAIRASRGVAPAVPSAPPAAGTPAAPAGVAPSGSAPSGSVVAPAAAAPVQAQ